MLPTLLPTTAQLPTASLLASRFLTFFTSSVAKNLKVFTSYKLKTLRIYQVSSSSLKVAISQLYLPICIAQRTQLNGKAHNQESRISFSRQVPTDLKPYYSYFITSYSQVARQVTLANSNCTGAKKLKVPRWGKRCTVYLLAKLIFVAIVASQLAQMLDAGALVFDQLGIFSCESIQLILYTYSLARDSLL